MQFLHLLLNLQKTLNGEYDRLFSNSQQI